MRYVFLPALIFCCFASDMTGTAKADDVRVLVEKLTKTAAPGNGINSEEQEVAKALQAIGSTAIPSLLSLLRNEDKDVRDLASYTLRDMEGLTDEHLDALMESCRRGDGWIPPAIASVGSPKAAKFLVDELVREPETQTQLTWALERLGPKAVPPLVELYRREKGWNENLEMALWSVFRELGEKAVEAVDPLLAIASDEKLPVAQRSRAIIAVGAIGLPAARAVPTLQGLQPRDNLKIQHAVTNAILNIGTAEAAPILVRSLNASEDPFDRLLYLRDIAELGARGRSAGPAVMKLLDDEDWTLRVGATRTLGYIGHAEAGDVLIRSLQREDDWRAVLSAAEALGRLQIVSAIPELSTIASHHWFPPVRQTAERATTVLRTRVPLEHHHRGDFSSEFFAYRNAGSEMESINPNEQGSIRLPLPATPPPVVKISIKRKDGPLKEEQSRGVAVPNGFLIGSNRGEWGGEISFVDTKGNVEEVTGGNTEAIYHAGGGVLAVTGLAHLSTNSGIILKVSQSANGRWMATNWRVLPGAPIFSRLMEDGSLFVSCHGGIVIVSPDGKMRCLTRREVGL